MGEPEPIDFDWYRFIGRCKLHLTFKETGRLTLRVFTRLYGHYKDDFDLEMRMKLSNTTYAELQSKAFQDEQWF